MFKSIMAMAWVGVLLLAGTPPVQGQQSTEMFIPVGQSPGVSNEISIIGTIETADAPSQTVAVAGASATWIVTVTDRTRIWLDKSKVGLTSQKGTFTDLGQGLLVEVKPIKAGLPGGDADWIKVQITEPGQAQ